MIKVAIVQRVLPHYRLEFFARLYQQLSEKGVELQLVYGNEKPGTVPRTIDVKLEWAKKIENIYINTPGTRLVWQPCLNEVKNSDLIIIEQANRLLLNYLLFFGKKLGGYKIAYWGHGRNMQENNEGKLSHRFKNALISKVDWWFAYTQLSADIVSDSDFPADKITVVQNTIETDEFKRAIDGVNESEINSIKEEVGLIGDNICLYCGGMYPGKDLDYIFDVCIELRERISDYQIVFIGDGPDQYKVEEFVSTYSWANYVGPKYGNEKAPYFKLSKALLMPRSVGLTIIDSFVAGTPLFTTYNMRHGPEIEYLENGVNGVSTDHTLNSYVNAIENYLNSDDMQKDLIRGCSLASKIYSLDNMVDNFIDGIMKCLK